MATSNSTRRLGSGFRPRRTPRITKIKRRRGCVRSSDTRSVQKSLFSQQQQPQPAKDKDCNESESSEQIDRQALLALGDEPPYDDEFPSPPPSLLTVLRANERLSDDSSSLDDVTSSSDEDDANREAIRLVLRGLSQAEDADLATLKRKVELEELKAEGESCKN